MTEEEIQTVGDESEIECPWCGKGLSVRDVYSHGDLKEGYEDQCYFCNNTFVIDAVDYDVTVYASRKRVQHHD